jgi:hypothetical protein
MNKTSPYPLRFEPILQYRNWGGARLNKLLKGASSSTEFIGEAWLLSDREGELAATHLVCAFAKPIAFATVLKALGQGLAKA